MDISAVNQVRSSASQDSGSQIRSLEQKLNRLTMEKQRAAQAQDKEKVRKLSEQIEKIQAQLERLKRQEQPQEPEQIKQQEPAAPPPEGIFIDQYA